MPTLDEGHARRRFADARVARLATAGADGVPHLVPVVFAVDPGSDGGADEIVFAVDGKPKSGRRLRRLANIDANPAVTLLVDHYDDDWSSLWWVRADGRARVDEDPATLTRARTLLGARYPQHRDDPPAGPAVVVAVTRWSGWTAAG